MLQHIAMRVLLLLGHIPHYFQIALVTAVYASVRRWWAQRQQRLLSEASKDWPTMRGRVVAVQALRDGTEEHKGKWSGLLTYSYILDEVEIGEYRQLFGSEAEADEWVRGLREKTVMVAVDPADKRRSIWVAEEAEAARKAAVNTLLEAETVELRWWVEAMRMVTLAVAGVGAMLSAMIEVREVYGHATATSAWATGGLSTGALICSGIAGYVFAKRFPGSRMGDIGKRFRDPVINLLLKGLGIVEGSLFFGLWWRFGEGNRLMDGLASNAIFSGLWGGLFVAAGVALWVAGRRLPVQHDLAPDRREQSWN